MSIKRKVKAPTGSKTKFYEAEDVLQRLTGGPLNIGRALAALRMSDEISHAFGLVLQNWLEMMWVIPQFKLRLGHPTGQR